MRQVWKFELDMQAFVEQPTQPIQMPKGARVLHLGPQGQTICIWAEVVPGSETVTRRFALIGTGHDFTVADEYRAVYVGTAVMPPHGQYVWHVYEIVERLRTPGRELVREAGDDRELALTTGLEEYLGGRP